MELPRRPPYTAGRPADEPFSDPFLRSSVHADRGTPEDNLALGERRAFTARAYLTALGIDEERLRTMSYGEERPVCAETDESCWSQNRRAHPVVTGRSNS